MKNRTLEAAARRLGLPGRHRLYNNRRHDFIYIFYFVNVTPMRRDDTGFFTRSVKNDTLNQRLPVRSGPVQGV